MRIMSHANYSPGACFTPGDLIARLRTFAAQNARQFARIDSGNGNHVIGLKIFGQRLRTAEITDRHGKITNNETAGKHLTRFNIFGVTSDIPDMRISQRDALLALGWVSEYFLVAGDGCIKNYFARTFEPCSVAFAAEDSAVFQRKDSLHRILRGVDLLDDISYSTPVQPRPAENPVSDV